MKSCFSSGVVSDEEIKETMVRCWKKNNYMLCPHTAVAAKYHYDNRLVIMGVVGLGHFDSRTA